MKQLWLLAAIVILLIGCSNSLESSLATGTGLSVFVAEEYEVLFCQKRVLDAGLLLADIKQDLAQIDEDIEEFNGELRDAESELSSAQNILQDIEEKLAKARAKDDQDRIQKLEGEAKDLEKEIEDAEFEQQRALQNIQRRIQEKSQLETLHLQQKTLLDKKREECAQFEKSTTPELCSKFNKELDVEIKNIEDSLQKSQKSLELWSERLKQETTTASQQRLSEILSEIQSRDKEVQKETSRLARLFKMKTQINELCAKN